MSLQLDYFASVVEHMTKLSGSKRTASLLCKSVFFISTGSNDMFEYSVSRGNDYEFLRSFIAAYRRYIRVRSSLPPCFMLGGKTAKKKIGYETPAR
jgi:hypothetical protein